MHCRPTWLWITGNWRGSRGDKCPLIVAGEKPHAWVLTYQQQTALTEDSREDGKTIPIFFTSCLLHYYYYSKSLWWRWQMLTVTVQVLLTGTELILYISSTTVLLTISSTINIHALGNYQFVSRFFIRWLLWSCAGSITKVRLSWLWKSYLLRHIFDVSDAAYRWR